MKERHLDELLPNIHPGEIIREEFMEPLGMTAYELAKGLKMPQSAVAQILRGERGVTAATALRLSRFLGCSPQFWLGLQADFDLEEAEDKSAAALDEIRRYDPENRPRRARQRTLAAECVAV